MNEWSKLMGATRWVAVTVEDISGIRGTHYVEVSKSLQHPEMYAARQEQEKGFRVIAACIY